MMAGRDITEGRATRAIAVDVGVVATDSIWQNTNEAYDVAIGGQPFFYAMNDQRPYLRETAPFRKDQFDNSTEPGEQSLTGWWIRSQSSFHNGSGIIFYDPTAGETVNYRFADSKGVDVWTKGDVTLLSNATTGHVTTHPLESNGRSFQQLRSIQWTTSGTTYNGVLLHDGYDVDKIDSTGAETHFVDYNAGSDDKVYAICDDGTTAFWVTNDTGPSGKLEVLKKNLDLNSTNAATAMFTANGITVTNATMEYVKERIVMCVNNSVYEFSSSAVALPTATYSHGDTDHIFTSITASGPAIYIAGYSGIQSNIYKFTLTTTSGVMPTLSQAITAAEMPTGEIIHKIYYYLGYMVIGTSKGIRVAAVNDQDGSLAYGPLIVETDQPCYDFAARDHYVWCATSVDGDAGVIRIDLTAEIEPLRFAWANDIYFPGAAGLRTTSCAFLGETDRLAFCTEAKNQYAVTNKARAGSAATLTTSVSHAITVGESLYVIGVDSDLDGGPFTVTAANTNTLTYNTATTATVATTSAVGFTGVPGYSYLESATEKTPTGYLTTGYIRYNTLEPKNFKRLLGRGTFDYGSMTLETVTKDGTEFDLISYDAVVEPVEVTINQPATAQEYLAYKFILNRDATDPSKGPVFQGYQGKSTIATPRQRLIQFPVFNFDTETDRYNVQTGYEGRALDRLAALEAVEQDGDVLTWQDFTTGESRQVVIEKISFTRETPPDKRFSGFGGVITMTIRTV
jgi:hypothetical protein